jgi:hypothetical protein
MMQELLSKEGVLLRQELRTMDGCVTASHGYLLPATSQAFFDSVLFLLSKKTVMLNTSPFYGYSLNVAPPLNTK